MLSLLTQFGASSSSGLGALGLNLQSFLIQLITFIIALLILKRFAFKPIMKVLKERRDAIEKGVSLGEQMEKEKRRLEENIEKQLHEARSKADDIIAEAQETAKATIHDAEDKAKTKSEGIISAAENRIAQEAGRTRAKLEQEMATLVADATEAVLKEKVDSKKDAELIERSLKEQRA